MDQTQAPLGRPQSSLSDLSALDWIAVGLVFLGAQGLLISHLWVSPVFVEMYRDFAAVLPFLTRLVLSGWYAGLAGLLPLLILALALTGRRRLSRRRLLIVIDFFLVAGLALFYWWALGLPLVQLADAVAA